MNSGYLYNGRNFIKAAAVAVKHIEAVTNHDYETARNVLADDVHFILVNAIPGFASPFEGNSIEEFMTAISSDNSLIPGSLKVLQSIGDDRQALIVVTVRATSPSCGESTLLAARHYIINNSEKITNEQVILSLYDGAV